MRNLIELACEFRRAANALDDLVVSLGVLEGESSEGLPDGGEPDDDPKLLAKRRVAKLIKAQIKRDSKAGKGPRRAWAKRRRAAKLSAREHKNKLQRAWRAKRRAEGRRKRLAEGVKRASKALAPGVARLRRRLGKAKRHHAGLHWTQKAENAGKVRAMRLKGQATRAAKAAAVEGVA